jgi:hypothetical protein
VAKKYADLVKTLAFRGSFARASGNARELTFMAGEQLAGFDLNFILGVYENTGDWTPERGSHTHPFDEYLLFFGYDPDDMSYLGSELELCMGEEWEPHKIVRPSFVIAPKDLPHSPLVTEKVDKPFGHLHIALSGVYRGGPGPEQTGSTDGTKYKYLFKEMEVQKGPGGADAHLIFSYSAANFPGLKINFDMGLYKETGQWSCAPHTHSFDEVMIFFGHNTADLSYLGAEITVELGAEREKHTFNVPTVVIIPRGTPHLPATCSRLENPYRVARIGLAPEYDETPVQL